MDPRVNKMAEVLVNYSAAVKPGDWVVIQTTVLGEPLANACVESTLRAGANPSVLLGSEDISETLFRVASDEQLDFVAPHQRLIMEEADVTIGILAPRNTRTLSQADPAKMARAGKAREPLSETMMRRSGAGELNWTLAAYPTPAAAQDAGMSLRDYEDFVFDAGLLDGPNPPGAWRELADRQQRLIDWLQGKETFHITGPGTDLIVGVAGRTWINDDGHKNFPGGEIFTGPREAATEGVIEFNFPAFHAGREVNGVRLVYKGGKVVEATAKSDEAYLHEVLNLDDGARILGEFAIGTNSGITRFTKNTLFDEKIGGTIHMALGRSIPGTGGENLSALHWDMVYNLRDRAEITVDGQLFSKNGEFCV